MTTIQQFVDATPRHVDRMLQTADLNSSGQITANEVDGLGDLKDSFERFSRLTGSKSIRRFKEFYNIYVPYMVSLNPYMLPADLQDNYDNFKTALRARQPLDIGWDGFNTAISNLVLDTGGLDLNLKRLEDFGFNVELGGDDLLPANMFDAYMDVVAEAEDDELGRGYVIDETVCAKITAGSQLIGFAVTIRSSDPEYGESGQNYLIVADADGGIETTDNESWAY